MSLPNALAQRVTNGQTDIVFVTGASRSGTTMMSRVLGNHTSILSLKELHYFGDLSDPARGNVRIGDRELEHLGAALFARQARGIWGSGRTESDYAQAKSVCARLEPADRSAFGVFAAVLSRLAVNAGRTMTCEQTPRNVFYADRILDAFPNARIIHMVRDPRAVLASQKNRWQLRRLGARNVPVSEIIRTWLNYHPITMSKLWADATRAALKLSDHPRFRIVRFEELVARPNEIVGEICDFLRVEFEPDMLDVPQWGSSNLPHEASVKGISPEVVNRWEQVLGAGEIGIAEWFTRAFMKRFSYAQRGTASNSAKLTLGWYLLSYPFHLLGVALANPRRGWIQVSAVLRNRGNE